MTSVNMQSRFTIFPLIEVVDFMYQHLIDESIQTEVQLTNLKYTIQNLYAVPPQWQEPQSKKVEHP